MFGGGFVTPGGGGSFVRVQNGTQATTNALATLGVQITSSTPFQIYAEINLSNMVSGDVFYVIEEKLDQDGVTWVVCSRSYYDARMIPETLSPMVYTEIRVGIGWRIRIQRTLGADRNVTYQFYRSG